MFENVHVDHLLVVTGPTSSGKSTLLELIDSGKVEGEMRSVLPEDVFGWKQLCHREYDGSLVSSKDEPVKGLVLHYDMMRPYKKFIDGYDEDVISELMDRANMVTVLIIKPEMDVLLEQLKRGELGGNSMETEPADLRLRRLLTYTFHMIPSGIRMMIKKKLFPNRKSSVTDFNKVLYFKYQEQGWVDDWYQKFDRFLDEKKSSGSNIRRFFVQAEKNNKNVWRILHQ